MRRNTQIGNLRTQRVGLKSYREFWEEITELSSWTSKLVLSKTRITIILQERDDVIYVQTEKVDLREERQKEEKAEKRRHRSNTSKFT